MYFFINEFTYLLRMEFSRQRITSRQSNLHQQTETSVIIPFVTHFKKNWHLRCTVILFTANFLKLQNVGVCCDIMNYWWENHNFAFRSPKGVSWQFLCSRMISYCSTFWLQPVCRRDWSLFRIFHFSTEEIFLALFVSCSTQHYCQLDSTMLMIEVRY